MQYNFRGKYDSTQSYTKKDVVSYQPTTNGTITFHLCLTDHTNASPQLPSQVSDNAFWGLLNAQSNFPNSVDSFLYRSPIQPSDKVDIERIKTLTLKDTLTPSEQDELSNLVSKQRNKLILAEDLNGIQQAISNMQMFYKDKIDSKLNENVQSINTTKDEALNAIEQKKNNVIEFMDGTTAGAIRNDIGIMGELTTTDKRSLVKAINEVNSKEVDLSPLEQQITTINNKVDTHLADDTAHVRYGTASGTNAKTITLNPAPTSLVEGFAVSFKNVTENTGAVSLNINSLGAKPVVKSNGSPLTSGNLKANSIYTVRYNGTAFILQGEGSDLSDTDMADFRVAVNGILNS